MTKPGNNDNWKSTASQIWLNIIIHFLEKRKKILTRENIPTASDKINKSAVDFLLYIACGTFIHPPHRSFILASFRGGSVWAQHKVRLFGCVEAVLCARNFGRTIFAACNTKLIFLRKKIFWLISLGFYIFWFYFI